MSTGEAADGLSRQLAEAAETVWAYEEPRLYCALARHTPPLLPAPLIHRRARRIRRDRIISAVLSACDSDPVLGDICRGFWETWRANALGHPRMVASAYPSLAARLLGRMDYRTSTEARALLVGPIAEAVRDNLLPLYTGLLVYQPVVSLVDLGHNHAAAPLLRETLVAWRIRAGEPPRADLYWNVLESLRDDIIKARIRETRIEDLPQTARAVEKLCGESSACASIVYTDLRYWLLAWRTHTLFTAEWPLEGECRTVLRRLLDVDPHGILEEGVIRVLRGEAAWPPRSG